MKLEMTFNKNPLSAAIEAARKGVSAVAVTGMIGLASIAPDAAAVSTISDITERKDMVSETERVVQSISDQSEESAEHINEFFTDFGKEARHIVDLQIAVDDLVAKGHLCQDYSQCPEQWDLIKGSYDNAMGNIQASFQANYPEIMPSFRSFNRTVYEGIDSLKDLDSPDLNVLPMEVEQYKQQFQTLQVGEAEVERKCREVSDRQCKRLLRSHARKAQKVNQNLTRLEYTIQVEELRSHILERMGHVLEGYTFLEEDMANVLTDYAFILENYGSLAGTQDVSRLMAAMENFKSLEQKTNDMQRFSKGLQQVLMSSGTVIRERLKMFSGQSGITAGSQTELIAYTTEINKDSKQRLKELEQKAKELTQRGGKS